jgi:hypothetical protein
MTRCARERSKTCNSAAWLPRRNTHRRTSVHTHPRGVCAVPPAVTLCNTKPYSRLSSVHRHEPSCANHLNVDLVTRHSRVELRRASPCAYPPEDAFPQALFRRTASSNTLLWRTISTLALAHNAFGKYNALSGTP